jgi:hypothetical protein
MTLFYTDLNRGAVEVREIPKMGRKAVDSNLLCSLANHGIAADSGDSSLSWRLESIGAEIASPAIAAVSTRTPWSKTPPRTATDRARALGRSAQVQRRKVVQPIAPG